MNTRQSLSKDTIYHLLQVQRRRYALYYLQETMGPVPMCDLVEQVAAWEYETTVDQIESSDRQRTYISLYQSHLPALDTEGVIEYDRERRLVTRKELASQLDPYLTTCRIQRSDESESDDSDSNVPLIHPWKRWYWGGVLISSVLLSMTVLDFPVVAQPSGRSVLSSVVLVFVLITIRHRGGQR